MIPSTRRLRFIGLGLLIALAAASAIISQFGPPGPASKLAATVLVTLAAFAAIAEIVSLFLALVRSPGPTPPAPSAAPSSDLSSCGSQSLSLGIQSLPVSSAFGMYFVGLLERPSSYLYFDHQINLLHPEPSPNPLDAIYNQLLLPNGRHVLVIASQGGMGKSTLAAQIIRCLYQRKAIKFILGDSAKAEYYDFAQSRFVTTDQSFADPNGFLDVLRLQIGLPTFSGDAIGRNLREINDHILDNRAVILVDNLDTVADKQSLIQALLKLASADIRILITTREVGELAIDPAVGMFAHLNYLQDPITVAQFLTWHIDRHIAQNPQLATLRPSLSDQHLLRKLIDCTGGVPLLIQIVASEIALTNSWERLDKLPRDLFGDDLLAYLYDSAWHDLESLAKAGALAQRLLTWVSTQQFGGSRITSSSLQDQFRGSADERYLPEALNALYQRFLLVNSDASKGNFSVTPSLAGYVLAHTSEVAPSPRQN